MAKNNLKTVENNQLTDQTDDQLEGVMEYSQDINDAERPEPLPVGEYPATIIEAKRNVGKESGRPYAQVSYRVESGDMPADYVEKWQVDSRTVIGRHFFLEDTPTARYNAKRFCEGVGMAMSNRLVIAEAVGLTCKIRIGHQDNLEGLPVENMIGLPVRA